MDAPIALIDPGALPPRRPVSTSGGAPAPTAAVAPSDPARTAAHLAGAGAGGAEDAAPGYVDGAVAAAELAAAAAAAGQRVATLGHVRDDSLAMRKLDPKTLMQVYTQALKQGIKLPGVGPAPPRVGAGAGAAGAGSSGSSGLLPQPRKAPPKQVRALDVHAWMWTPRQG